MTMLRVYCTCPGASASWKRRRGGDERAVGDVDRDPLLALGAQAVGEQREVDVAVAAALARSPRCARAGRPGSASCRRAAGRSASTCRRRPSPRSRGGSSSACEHRLRSSQRACGPPSRPRDTRSSARVSPRSVTFVAAISVTTSSIVAACDSTPPVQRHVADGAEADGRRERLLVRAAARRRRRPRRASRRGGTPRARGRSRSTAARAARGRCTARRRARSSSRSGRRGCARPCGCGAL